MKTFLFITLAIVATASAEPVTITFKSGGSMTGPLVAKSDWEIKIESDYGIIPLQISAVTQESWTNAQRAKLSKPSGKYIQPQVTTRKLEGATGGPKVEKQGTAFSVADIKRAYAENAVAADLRFEGKQIAVSGVISDIDRDILGAPFVTLEQKVMKIFARGSEKQIAHLKIGQTVTLTGNCHGMSLGLLLIRE